TWDTNESSTSIVNYGLTASYGSQESDLGLLPTHSIGLSALSENTLYHYQVCSADASSNQACSSDNTFTTLDETPPVISNVVVSSITETGATITWDTNESSNSNVDYDEVAGPPYTSNTTDASMVTSHSIDLAGLAASTTYHYRVRSVDSSTNESFTTDATFTTSAPPDSTAPVISNVQVTGITQTEATITWDTNESSDSKVDYDTDGTPYDDTSTDATMVTSHSISLSGLTADTLYHFIVRSADAAANEASSTDATFTTLPVPDTTAPVISNVVVSAITGTGATISWNTDEQATQFVDYDTDGALYDDTSGSAAPLQTSHSVVLSGLTSDTVYHYSVRSADVATNEASTVDATFTTVDVTPPVISALTAVSIGVDTATITWTTNESADSAVDYDNETSEPYADTSTDATMVTSHSIVLGSLTADTTYYYRVRSSDSSANEGTSAELTFTTLEPPDTTAPVISSVQVSALGATSATITWTTDESADSNVDYGFTAGYGSTESDATDVTSHSITLSGLSENTTYHYSVRSADAATNESSSTDATFKTIDATAPSISNVNVSGITETGATITWDTNENADSHVDFDLVAGPPYGIEESDATDVTSHSITLSGLSAKTLYHFRVRSIDPEDNESSSGDSSFTTLDTTAPSISNIQVTDITDSGATITWTTNEDADSAVDYGITSGYGVTEVDAADVTSHSIAITGLDPVVEYHFRVRSSDSDDNEASSTDQTFTTIPPPAPVISNIQITAVTQTTVTITWDTDILSTSKVQYGGTVSYGNTKNDVATVTTHSVFIENLNKNTTYHYKVSSKDQYDQVAESADDTFATAADTSPPGNVAGFTSTPGVNSVTLTWTNPTDPDFDGVWVVRKEGSQPTDKDDGTWIYVDTGTSYTDVGLDNETTYYYGAFSFDDVPNYASGAFASATPDGPPDFTPPPNVDPFDGTSGDQQVQLNWTNPVDPDFAAVRIMRKTAGYPTDKNDGTLVYDGNGESKLDTGLTNDTTYYYRAFSYDGALNYSSGKDVTVTPVAPPDVTAPAAVSVFVADAGDGVIQLTWVNPTDVDFAGVRVLRKKGSAPAFNTDGTIVYEGISDNKLDTGLTNELEYFYTAFTFDTSSNWSGGVSVSATPAAGTVAEPPSCSDTDGGQNYVLLGTVTEGESEFIDVCASSANLIENYCFASAAAIEVHDCGEGFKCSAGRCVADTVEVDAEVCGNGICAGAENSLSCPVDCPVESTEEEVEEEGETVVEEERLGLDYVYFLATGKRLRMGKVNGNHIITFPKMTIIVYLPDSSIIKPIFSAFVNFQGNAYAMKSTASYEATVLSPSALGSYPLGVVVNYEDGTSDSLDYVMDVYDFGTVYEVIDGNRVPVEGARVTLLKDPGSGSFGVVDSGTIGQSNPQLTNENGAYGYIVDPGIYKLKAEKEGYRTKEKIRFPLVGHLVKEDMQLIFIPPPPVEEINEILDSDAGAGEKAAAVAGVAVDQAAYATKAVVEDIGEVIGNQIVEDATEDYAAPTVAAVAVANVASAGAATATAIPYMMYLYSFLA
ncbi:fibronectin type III domain-containing protein, partial [Patescibacteria group bacterium]